MFRWNFTSFRQLALVGVLAFAPLSCAMGQFGVGGIIRGVVGGVKVDADGVVRDASIQERGDQLQQLRAATKLPTGDLAETSNLRMISLKKLQSEIQSAIAEDRPLSEEVLFLAGLQRVEYVFAYPEQNDIVIAGPAEAWVVRDDSSVVGKQSGKPVLRLEDLLVALRTTETTQREAISVSIDPTAEGEVRLQQLLSRLGGNGLNPQAVEPAIKEAFGPQMITLTAVPKDSRMAQTLVAADYQMKRLAMQLENSPVAGLPSYMEMIRNGGAKQGTQPRWWITTAYDQLLHSQDRLAWKITGTGIKALSEDEFVTQTGQRVGKGSANKLAKKWADLFTAKYDQLSETNSVFGDLRNVIDLNVVAAIIRSQNLEQVAGCELSLMSGADSKKLETPHWQVPQTLNPQCSFVRGSAGWTISASGGVEINPYQVVRDAAKVDDAVKATYTKAGSSTNNWWWN